MAMNTTVFIIKILLFSHWFGSAGEEGTALSSLSLNIDELRSDRGAVHVAVYDREDSFAKSLKPYRLRIYKVPADRKLVIRLDSIPPGRYALAAYHDENGNGNLDKNMLGIPKEPYGFSNNPRAKWSAPKYEEVSFALNGQPARLSVSVKTWKER